MKEWKYAFVAASIFAVGGCILPIPHRRTERFGISGVVTDADNEAPIAGASVLICYSDRKETRVQTDLNGKFAIEDEEGWHGALAFGIGEGCSFFPLLVYGAFPRVASVSAEGYRELLPVTYPIAHNEDTDLTVGCPGRINGVYKLKRKSTINR